MPATLNRGLTFTVSQSVKTIGWTGVCLRIDGLQNKAFDPDFKAVKHERLKKVFAELTSERLKTDPVLHGFTKMHQAIGHSNRETVAAPTALLKILLNHGGLPQVNLLVDIYNLISTETRLALGAHDIAKISGNVVLQPTTGDEPFWPIGAAGPQKVRPGDYAYLDSANDVLCWLEVKQVEKTKVDLDTSHCLYIIQGNRETPKDYLLSAARELIELTTRFCGGTATMLYQPGEEE